ncbi:hypothetical protein CYY_002487 [Polysphondylium violaceum]|uniref:non-specific serine/threonine protein kinase n=1 Tax=Polysphondylium violaceum TaxID=133409 RepID=A0A8J4V6U5_9MYCE|nr:hypothetical protein CYY_002487 [Polysphondylium violaceum]
MSIKSPLQQNKEFLKSTDSGNGSGGSSNSILLGKSVSSSNIATSNKVVVVGQDTNLERLAAALPVRTLTRGVSNHNIKCPSSISNSVSSGNLPPISTNPLRNSSSKLPPPSPTSFSNNTTTITTSLSTPSSPVTTNSLNSSPNSKPLPKPPGYLQKIKEIKNQIGHQSATNLYSSLDSINSSDSNGSDGKTSKPNPGLLYKAYSESNITLNNNIVIKNDNDNSSGLNNSNNSNSNSNDDLDGQEFTEKSPPLNTGKKKNTRCKSASISEYKSKGSSLNFPPLPPTPLTGMGLPPLPPIPKNSSSSLLPSIQHTQPLTASLSSPSSCFLIPIPPANNQDKFINNPPLPTTPSHHENLHIMASGAQSLPTPTILMPMMGNQNLSPNYLDQQSPFPYSTSLTSSVPIHQASSPPTPNSMSPIPSPVVPKGINIPDNTSTGTSGSTICSPEILSPKGGKPHSLKLKYFTQPTRCHICTQFIWSLIGKQGFICTDCGNTVHKFCVSKLKDVCTCSPPKRRFFFSDKEKEKELLEKQIDSLVDGPIQTSISTPPSPNVTYPDQVPVSVSQPQTPISPRTYSTSSDNSNHSSTSINNSPNINQTNVVHSNNNTDINNNNYNMLISSNSSNNSETISHSHSGTFSPNSESLNTTSNSSSKKNRKSGYESMLRDFQINFKGLIPQDETLVTSYSCGYQGSSIKHGRLYITEYNLCFYDNLVFDKSKARQKIIPVSSITSIERKSSGLAPNGIVVHTEDRDFQFCLFIHREEAFDVLETLLIHRERQLLSESIHNKNLDGMRKLLHHQRGRQSVIKGSKRSKSTDNSNSNSSTVFNSLRNPHQPTDESHLITVIKSNDLEMVQLLLEYYNSNKSNEINHLDNDGYTPLHVAVSSDCSDDLLTQLIRHPSIQIEVRNVDGNTALHYFCQRFRSPECQKIAQLLIDKGSNVNAQNHNGETPLHKAIFNHSVRLLMVYVLLKNNADVNIVNVAGESPLHYAVRLGRLDVLKILITAGADPTLLSSRGKKSPLLLAEEHNNSPEIVDLLRRLEIIINSLNMSSLNQYKMALILEELNKEGSFARLDEAMLASIGCYDEDHKKRFYSLKNQRIFISGPPAVTPGAKDLLKELENMDIKNGKWIISETDLEYTDKIGSGGSGKVYKGLYRGREVAIKVLKSAEKADDRESFLKEFTVLGSLQSTLIVGLYGVVLEPKICLVMEYCSKGSLFAVLQTEKVTWEKFFSFSHQLLKGVSTLHMSEPQILHRDIKTLNFLVTKDGRIKVADFGLSRFNTKSNQMTLNKTRGTVTYCAPEVFQGQEYSEKSDVYSMGIVFWELVYTVINQRYLRPYGEYKNFNEFQILLHTANQNLRPTIPTTTPPSVKLLISRCWDKNITTRPTCNEAIALLVNCEKEFQSKQAEWNQCIQPINLSDSDCSPLSSFST